MRKTYNYYCFDCGEKVKKSGPCANCGCPTREQVPKGGNPYIAGKPNAQQFAITHEMTDYLEWKSSVAREG